ncbi:MAG: hypothetical protein AAFQ89_10305 [Cyanobacteria bacterium J06626_18]
MMPPKHFPEEPDFLEDPDLLGEPDFLAETRSQEQRSRQRRQRWIRLFLLSAVLPALLLSISWIVPGALEVAQTGECPPTPTDVLPRVCSVGDYIFRRTFSLWAIVGHLLIWSGWIATNVLLWIVGIVAVAFYRSLRSD